MIIQVIFSIFVFVAMAQDEKACKLRDGGNGSCKTHSLCPEAFEHFPEVLPVTCGFSGRSPQVCCPVKSDTPTSTIDISPPNVDFTCGDAPPCPDCIPGGGPARTAFVKYSVLMGTRNADDGSAEWFCTGVLINNQWVLTAAQCDNGRLNVARLGERNYKDINDDATPVTLDVIQIVSHPDYSHPESYHDLALAKLQFPVDFRRFINPVCLPWGVESNRNLVNETVYLSGWGATGFGGIQSSLLLETNLTVFATSLCDENYSVLPHFRVNFPRGMGEETLCIGDPIGGNDACMGDSGGPVTYLNSANQYVLAGIVSSGYGCGLKEFPGIYVNISYPLYLDWIKKVAFL